MFEQLIEGQRFVETRQEEVRRFDLATHIGRGSAEIATGHARQAGKWTPVSETLHGFTQFWHGLSHAGFRVHLQPKNPGTPSTELVPDRTKTKNPTWSGQDRWTPAKPEVRVGKRMALAAERVVFPTPPFPPNNSSRAMVWLRNGAV